MIVLVIGLGVGFGVGAGAGLAAVGGSQPTIIGNLRLSKALNPQNLAWGLGAGLAWGLGAGVAAGVAGGVAAGVADGVVGGLVGGLVFGLVVGLQQAVTADSDTYSSLNPSASWHSDRRYGLVFGLAFGLAGGLSFGLGAGLTIGRSHGVATGVAAGLAVGLTVLLLTMVAGGLMATQTWAASLASVQLALEWDTRIRLMKFLDDALSRNVLRAVGPAYQFRHARLQDRLAAAAITAQRATLPWPPKVGEVDEGLASSTSARTTRPRKVSPVSPEGYDQQKQIELAKTVAGDRCPWTL